jgi:hypothetical protein
MSGCYPPEKICRCPECLEKKIKDLSERISAIESWKKTIMDILTKALYGHDERG